MSLELYDKIAKLVPAVMCPECNKIVSVLKIGYETPDGGVNCIPFSGCGRVCAKFSCGHIIVNDSVVQSVLSWINGYTTGFDAAKKRIMELFE